MRQSIVDNITAMIRDATHSAAEQTDKLLSAEVKPCSVDRWAYVNGMSQWLITMNPVLDLVDRWVDRAEACSGCTPMKVELFFRSSVEYLILNYIQARFGEPCDDAMTPERIEKALAGLLDSTVHAHED